MKLIVCVIFMFISAKECDKKQLASENISEVMTTELAELKMQDRMKISYRAATRGFYLQIWIEGDSIKYTSDNTLKAISIHQIPIEEKESLMKLIDELNEKTLPDLVAPSTRHQFDGAAIATLEITNGEDSYRTVAFDHGNAPKSIALLVEKMLSIKTMFEKQ
jgi:heat shock protein HslJ